MYHTVELLWKTGLYTRQEGKEASHLSGVFRTVWGLTNKFYWQTPWQLGDLDLPNPSPSFLIVRKRSISLVCCKNDLGCCA